MKALYGVFSATGYVIKYRFYGRCDETPQKKICEQQQIYNDYKRIEEDDFN